MAKASDNEFPSVLLGEQASTPSTPSAGTARLFVDNSATPQLKLVDDAATVTTFGSGGGGTVPEWVELLDAAASPNGDDEEFDATLGGTNIATTGTATWTQDNDLLSCSFTNQSVNDMDARVWALTTPSSPITIETRINTNSLYFANNPSCGILFTDGTTSAANVAGVGVGTNTSSRFITQVTGTVTNFSLPATVSPGRILERDWTYLRYTWISSNTFGWSWSPDGVSWTDFATADMTPTITPTHFGVWVSSWSNTSTSIATWEYLRRTNSDLSV